MREIKFRAWSQEKGIFFYYSLQPKFGFVGKAPNSYNDAPSLGVWQQYTGLKDKNGKEIYEGDIVRAKGAKQGVYEVRSVSFGLGCEPFNDDYFLDGEDTEVIGNIYENKELLK